MTHLKYSLAAVAAAGLIGAATVAAAQSHEPSKGSMVTLTSCVEKGQKADTYVLTHVADVPVHPPTKGGRVVYWLDRDTAKTLAPLVGHQIRVSGTVTDVEKQEMEVKVSDDGGIYVELEGPGRDVRTRPGSTSSVVTAAGRPDSKSDIKTTVVKLKVDKLEMVAANCPLAK